MFTQGYAKSGNEKTQKTNDVIVFNVPGDKRFAVVLDPESLRRCSTIRHAVGEDHVQINREQSRFLLVAERFVEVQYDLSVCLQIPSVLSADFSCQWGHDPILLKINQDWRPTHQISFSSPLGFSAHKVMLVDRLGWNTHFWRFQKEDLVPWRYQNGVWTCTDPSVSITAVTRLG